MGIPRVHQYVHSCKMCIKPTIHNNKPNFSWELYKCINMYNYKICIKPIIHNPTQTDFFMGITQVHQYVHTYKTCIKLIIYTHTQAYCHGKYTGAPRCTPLIKHGTNQTYSLTNNSISWELHMCTSKYTPTDTV